MLNKLLLLSLMWLLTGPGNTLFAEQGASLSTLFTTSEERKLIDANRYRGAQQVDVVTQSSPKVESVEEMIEETTVSMILAGFTLTQSGQNVAWVNGKPYENGSKLDDGSILIISRKKSLNVQIKTPDGKYHNLTAGKAVDVSYLKPLNEG